MDKWPSSCFPIWNRACHMKFGIKFCILYSCWLVANSGSAMYPMHQVLLIHARVWWCWCCVLVPRCGISRPPQAQIFFYVVSPPWGLCWFKGGKLLRIFEEQKTKTNDNVWWQARMIETKPRPFCWIFPSSTKKKWAPEWTVGSSAFSFETRLFAWSSTSIIHASLYVKKHWVARSWCSGIPTTFLPVRELENRLQSRSWNFKPRDMNSFTCALFTKHNVGFVSKAQMPTRHLFHLRYSYVKFGCTLHSRITWTQLRCQTLLKASAARIPNSITRIYIKIFQAVSMQHVPNPKKTHSAVPRFPNKRSGWHDWTCFPEVLKQLGNKNIFFPRGFPLQFPSKGKLFFKMDMFLSKTIFEICTWVLGCMAKYPSLDSEN